MTVKVTNLETKAVYVHYKLTKRDIGWISLNPNLKIEILKDKRPAWKSQ